MKPIFVKLCALLFCILSPIHALANPSLDALENMAKSYLDDDKPELALNIYQQYQSLLETQNYNPLNPQLLFNQAIAAYRAGHTGLAIAYLKQLNIIQESSVVSDAINKLRLTIEHKVYQNAPDTAFIRGYSKDYNLWAHAHRMTKPQLHGLMLALWTAIFLLTGFSLAKRHISKNRLNLILLVFLSLICILFCIIACYAYQRIQSEHMTFAVLINNHTLRSSDDPNAPPIHDNAFVEGLTLRILDSKNGWSQIRRADGKIAWCPSQDLYILKAKD